VQHLSHVSKNCFLSLSPFYSLRNILYEKARLNIVSTVLLSKLFYAPCVWFKSSKAGKNKINNIIRSCARYVLCKSKFDSIALDNNDKLEWLNCDYRFKFKCLKLTYLVLSQQCPTMFRDYVCLDDISCICTRNCSHFSTGPKSLQCAMALESTKLPNELQSCNSYNIFKHNTYKYLLNRQKM